MKTIKIIFQFTFLLYSTFSFTQGTNAIQNGYKNDLHIYQEILEKSHSGLYLYTPKPVFDSIFKQANHIVENEDLSERDFYLLISNIHTQIRCGHSSTSPSEKIFQQIDTTKIVFLPFDVKFIKDSLILTKNFRSVDAGAQIIAINGKTVEEITSDAFKIMSSDGYNETFKYRQLEQYFFYYYFILYGESNTIKLKYIPYNSKVPSVIEINRLKEGDFTFEEKELEPYYLTFVNDSKAILTVNTFSTNTKINQLKFFRFLKKSFKEIHKKGIETLIVDVRENTGGDDGNDMRLASYLINESFSENKYRQLKTLELPIYPEYLTNQWKEMMGLKDKNDAKIVSKMQKTLHREFYQAEDSLYYYKEKKIIHEKKRKYGFYGNKYILISGNVFSGGALFSALVRDKSNAVFIGEETGGGYYRHTGSIPLEYQLPYSGIEISLFIVVAEQNVNQHLFPNGHGTRPHFEVYPTRESVLNGQDIILQFVLNR